MAATVVTLEPLLIGTLTGPGLYRLASDPTSGGGQAAALGSLLMRTDTGQVYWKSGAGNTAWTLIGGTNSSYQPAELWAQNNVAANQTNVDLQCQVSTNFATTWIAIRAGSIIGLASRLVEAVTAGTLTVRVTVNGTSGTLAIASTSGSNPTGGVTTQATGIDTFVAGDALGVEITTTAGYTPTTNSVEAYIQVRDN